MIVNSSLEGRLKKIKLSKREGLLPIIEAVVNSIDAIEDGKQDKGRITVTLHRNVAQTALLENAATISPVKDVEIIDNGIGFDEQNYRSFLLADSMYKAGRGGLGIGRFLWLKAFDSVEVESVFSEGSLQKRRTFKFSLEDDPNDSVIEEVPEDTPNGTKIKLLGFKEPYSDNTVRGGDVIARHIVERCLRFFILERMPLLEIIDGTLEESILSANKIYNDLVKEKEDVPLTVGEESFNLTHVMLKARAGLEHKISYCANHRVVKEKKISSNRINGLGAKLNHSDDEDEGYIYSGYVSSGYLDNHVNDERNDFRFPREDELGTMPSYKDIEDSVFDQSREYLSPFTSSNIESNRKRIEEYIQDKRPMFRPLAKYHEDRFDQIPADINEEALDVELYKIDRDVGWELKKQIEEILSSETPINLDEYQDFIREYDEHGKSRLAEYIGLRHYILRILEQALKASEDGKYSKEEAIHQWIFPMRKTSDEITHEHHNLWVIDEKLAYHHYLASDKPLKSQAALNVDSQKEPDILIFNRPIATVSAKSQPYQSIVLFEFKKPMRKGYGEGEDKNPIDQVINYISLIKQDKVLDKDGRTFHVAPTTPFYCYVIADITSSLRGVLDKNDLTPTPDGLGYFYFHKTFNAYIEVISFDKLIQDAVKRNKILFDQLNLPT